MAAVFNHSGVIDQLVVNPNQGGNPETAKPTRVPPEVRERFSI
jgi:hypothetical protein